VSMFEGPDPRTRLASSSAPPTVVGAPAADFVIRGVVAGQAVPDNEDDWSVRGQNFVVHVATLQAGEVLEREAQVDEYVVLLPDADSLFRMTTPAETIEVRGRSLVIVPPGRSVLEAKSGGRVQRLFTAASARDLVDRSVNAESYRELNAQVAEFAAWPEPPDGYRVRVYSLDVPDEPGRFGRIWRCTTFMVNYFAPQRGPRDPSKLSPHTHDDFEQCSIGIDGDFVHHLRWPWGVDRSTWRSDEHVVCPSPSVTVIPPTVVHTTEAVGLGKNQLVDVFCPPRLDFSQVESWVLNADEYPLPFVPLDRQP
jgi:hypothetical protein